MALVKFADGPLKGEEKEVTDPDTMGVEFPGYSPVEQVSDPQKGQLLKAQWSGEAAALSYYPNPDQDDESDESDGASKTPSM